MKRIPFCFIFSILLFNIVQSKKYLVEVEDEKGDSIEEHPASPDEDATIESDGMICLMRTLFVYRTITRRRRLPIPDRLYEM